LCVQLAIPFANITRITKEKSARVIPNAIQVCTSSEKMFFTSIGSRDRIHSLLSFIWKKVLSPQVITLTNF